MLPDDHAMITPDWSVYIVNIFFLWNDDVSKKKRQKEKKKKLWIK